MGDVGTNWAGNYEFRAPEVRSPESVQQLQGIVGTSRRIRALGTRHSFNDFADSAGTLESPVDREPEPRLDTEGMTVSVATGTHGSGNALGSLATAVCALQMVTGRVICSRSTASIRSSTGWSPRSGRSASSRA